MPRPRPQNILKNHVSKHHQDLLSLYGLHFYLLFPEAPMLPVELAAPVPEVLESSQQPKGEAGGNSDPVSQVQE